MRKSTIWLLALVMAFAFAGLLYLQITYLSIILKTRNEQFSEAVKTSLYQVSRSLELEESARYLEEDLNENEKMLLYDQRKNNSNVLNSPIVKEENLKFKLLGNDGVISEVELKTYSGQDKEQNLSVGTQQQNRNIIEKTSRSIQDTYLRRYLNEHMLLSEVIRNKLYKSSLQPIQERIDFNQLKVLLRDQFRNNGLNIPFHFSVINKDDQIVYQDADMKLGKNTEVFTQILFQNDPPSKLNYLRVFFPTQKSYIFSNITFLAPSIAFTLVLLMTFIFTIYIVFRQKKLSEMKNDFINNMTHELKTPVSTISLAAQMLKDTDITKSPEIFKHISGVIHDETKRLSFLVEKVLQMSLFERQKASLKLKEIDANDLLANIANTFVLKVEKYGGTLDIDLEADESTIYVDEMHFTNVLFNLMDNAVKYRKPEVPLKLMARTWNENGKLFISVEDNGIGIKKEYLKKVFDRFFRAPSGNVHDVKGFGLGLAYVRKIVEDHNGTIKAESELNMGTKFIISLPLIK